jgi:hypothetical protein
VEVACLNLVLVKIWEGKKNNNEKRRIPTHLLAHLLPLISKELKINGE